MLFSSPSIFSEKNECTNLSKPIAISTTFISLSLNLSGKSFLKEIEQTSNHLNGVLTSISYVDSEYSGNLSD